jgi:hypothetical protein
MNAARTGLSPDSAKAPRESLVGRPGILGSLRWGHDRIEVWERIYGSSGLQI